MRTRFFKKVSKKKMKAREVSVYYALEEIQKENQQKRKRLLYEFDRLEKNKRGGDDGLKNRIKRMKIKMTLDTMAIEKNELDSSIERLADKYDSRISSGFGTGLIFPLKLLMVEQLKMTIVIYESTNQNGNKDALLIDAKTELANHLKELDLYAHPRPISTIPAIILPLVVHPGKSNLCLETGLLNADIWRNLLFSLDRASLRTLRLCNVSLAILVHSLPSENTGYYFCT